MNQIGSITLFQYWNQLRDGRPAPKRSEVEPADIKSLLADTFILERDTRGEAVFRLAGTRLCAYYGRELKGFSFPSLWREKDQRLVSRLIHGVFDQKSLLLLTYEGFSRNGRSNKFELLALPLDSGVENPRCLGVVSAANRPFWLGADPLADALIDAIRIIDPDREPMFLKNRPAIDVPSLVPTELDAPETISALGRVRRIRHLVVFDGGRNE
ncbi:PAS domain-containing protein [Mesorhizobium sp. M1C.F.Ca.ET.193.01.1.1]|uniref:PAS domain-containing protein n=1 Tax=unclassified Mesorhizobium TaxID=325217 RepID=UPI000FD2399E|nr:MULTISPECIES: PAS domain-containing protein [unclassified Mesorhizobium]TGT03255.1 PAS domain-containing protein [bacterium M00.F.Ca.ET.177.01.1.1]TGQ55932.1 PAS domain-containing protein [Mesorhizobium sp. M1C.F.Ca.ET.210.01.1.1]TGQ75017.1 PAS domain-containing protein [Mesorhizobium sp. M1C.F.Ca.ET.212.01.1.1]TGR13429.1 PAS domain-containing protein [Mesorhizobium sp. M1C.F.Ca.ET.204.01.1.1]TGR33706.1 PAS domain-containing protein [Mesorhizobium sp. M1C.F.Ca.ET.196.01.1.1]